MIEYNRNTYQQGYVSAQDGVRLFYRLYGNRSSRKVSILCLSGLTRNSKDFHELALILGQERLVVSVDYRGRGKSDYDCDWRNYNPETYIRDAHNLLVSLNISRVFVIGTSLGGIIAMGMGVAMPILIAGVLLNDIGPEISKTGFCSLQRYLSVDKIFENWLDVANNFKHYFPNLGNYSMKNWIDIVKGCYQEQIDGKIVQDWDPKVRKSLKLINLRKVDLWPLFLSLKKIPVALLRGENSSILAPETFNKMVDLNPVMKAITISNVGHAPTLMEPTSRAILREVLNQVDASNY